jgi:hypothetical protein
MATIPNKWAVAGVAKCTFWDLTDGHVITYLDTLQTSGVSTKSETVYLRGKVAAH